MTLVPSFVPLFISAPHLITFVTTSKGVILFMLLTLYALYFMSDYRAQYIDRGSIYILALQTIRLLQLLVLFSMRIILSLI